MIDSVETLLAFYLKKNKISFLKGTPLKLLMAGQNVPIIDISGWGSSDEAKKDAVAAAFDDIFARHGYGIVIGTDFDVSALQCELVQEAAAFFALPLEEKMAFCHGPYGHQSGGYTPIHTEKVSKSIEKNQTDGVESFVFWGPPLSFKMPSGESGCIPFQVAASKLWDSNTALLTKLHNIAARALGMSNDEEFFNRLYFEDDGSGGGNGLTLKISWYPRCNSISDDGEEREELKVRGGPEATPLRYGEHTDYQGFTLLKPDGSDWESDDHGGLECLDQCSGHWVPVFVPREHARDGLVVNAGDLMSVWSNGRWHSPVHRVRAPSHRQEVSSRHQDRCSIIFFTGPQSTTLVEPITRSSDESLKFAPVEAGQHLARKILASRSIVA